MEKINEDNLILEKYVFDRSEIEWRMNDGGFNSISRFELFIWDLEMFLQIQQELGDKIILKGGAATQFYLPITAQRTSVDIDMLCLASKEEVKKAIEHIEKRLGGESNVFKFVPYEPQNPRINLEDLNTYCPTARSGRHQTHFKFGAFAFLTVQYSSRPQIYSGSAAYCRSLV